VNAREVVAALKADGWVLARTKGSHAQYRHPTKPGLGRSRCMRAMCQAGR